MDKERPVDNPKVNVITVNVNPSALVNVNPTVNVNAATINVNPTALVLMNPLIMDKIFGYLTVKEVKNARTVCKIWESVGATCLGRQCSFSINKFCQEYAEIGFRSSPPPNHQLVRRVNIDNCGVDVGKKIDYDFLNFVMKYQENVEEIQFDVNRHFAPTIKWVLEQENVNLCKLKKITLIEHHHSISRIAGYGWDAFNNLNFLPLPTLTVLNITSPADMKGRDGGSRVDEKDGFPYYQIVQEIINKSPNLGRLEIGVNFYPDLSCCRKLKVLKLEGHLFKPFPLSGEDNDVDAGEQQIEIREDFSYSKMLKMLHQVKETVEELVIDTSVGNYLHTDTMEVLVILGLPPQTNIEFPSFSCLRRLSVYPFDAYVLEFEKLTENHLPNLQKLILQEYRGRRGYLDEVILATKSCWSNVEHLFLNGFLYERDDPSIFIGKIVKTFPNTKEFRFRIKGNLKTDPTPGNFQRFKDTLFAIGTADWNIQHLEINIGFRITLSKLMDALGEVVSLNGFTQLKTLELSCFDLHIRDRGCNNFEKTFTALRSITFSGIKFRGTTLIKMAKFIGRHDLNIQFNL